MKNCAKLILINLQCTSSDDALDAVVLSDAFGLWSSMRNFSTGTAIIIPSILNIRNKTIVTTGLNFYTHSVYSEHYM